MAYWVYVKMDDEQMVCEWLGWQLYRRMDMEGQMEGKIDVWMVGG